jgi:probable addiction module antidote protein
VALGDVARAHGMMRIARETGLAREALYRALSGKGNPELATVLRVLKALGLQLSIRPAKARNSRRT